MRTTVRLNEALMRKVKQYALDHNQTLTSVIEEALNDKLTRRNEASKPFVLITARGNLQPGVNLDSNAELLEQMEEGLDVASRR